MPLVNCVSSGTKIVVMKIKSRCSTKGSWEFHWYDGVNCSTEDPIEVAVTLCVEAISGPNRLRNPFADTVTKAEFRSRLKAATEGALEPGTQVKLVGRKQLVEITEIRWQDIPVVERSDGPTGREHKEVLVRMYLSEPDVLPFHLLGHLVHEKIVIAGDAAETNRLQTLEMFSAARIHLSGQSHRWGLP